MFSLTDRLNIRLSKVAIQLVKQTCMIICCTIYIRYRYCMMLHLASFSATSHSVMLLIPIETVLLIWIHTGGDAINLAHHTTIEFKCTTNGDRTPDWFVNGSVVVTTGDSYGLRTSNGRGITATLTIDGNGTQVILNIYCEVYEENQFVHMHRTTVIFQGLFSSCNILLSYFQELPDLVLKLNLLPTAYHHRFTCFT